MKVDHVADAANAENAENARVADAKPIDKQSEKADGQVDVKMEERGDVKRVDGQDDRVRRSAAADGDER